MPSKTIDRYLLALLICASLYAILWTLYVQHLYATFVGGFWDLGDGAYSFYLHLYHPGITSGLQYFVFMNHISIFAVLLLPILFIFKSPITLSAIQNIFIGATALLIFAVAKNITKRSSIGFALGLLFLLNPGVWGISIFDFHLEAFIPFFCILAFYFYQKGSRIGFVASYVLMLSTIETAPFVGIMILLGLLYYEVKYAKIDSRNIRAILACIGMTIIFYLFYHFTASSLVSLYTTNSYYASLPQIERLLNYVPSQIAALGNVVQLNGYVLTVYLLGLVGIVILLIGLGSTSLLNLKLTTILISPWLAEIYLLHNPYFYTFNNEYYAYGIGGAVIATLLGLKFLYSKKTPGSSLFGRFITKKNLYLRFSLAISIVVFVLTYQLAIVYSSAVLQPTAISSANLSSINKMLGSIPANSTMMAQYSISPHLYYVSNLELTPGSTVPGFTSSVGALNLSLYSFEPKYIIIDPQLPDFANINNTNSSIYSYMSNNYTLVNSTGGMQIYKQK